jgi:serine/threonine protein kinase
MEDLRWQLSECRAIGRLPELQRTISTDADPGTTQEQTPVPMAIGKYLVVGRFGPSGQAEVYRVVHPQFHRDLVLKLAKSPLGLAGRSTIIAEGRHLAGLEHPNIVQVHDLDFHEGRPFLVMEYIRSRALAQYAREEDITPRRAAALVAELAGAVAFAHRRGVVHQDIKPANILIDETGRPRLIDFGLAWQQDAWSGPSARSEGGTYAYIAPEQARLEPDRVRTLSDIFALGAVLYFLLTGRAPFTAATEVEVRDRACRGEFDRSALKAAGVPRRLEWICLRAMAAEPAERPATAEDLAADLDRWLRRPRWALCLIAAVALLLAGALCWWLLHPRPLHQRPEPNSPAQNAPASSRDPVGPVPAPGAPPVERPGAPKGPQYLVQVFRADQVFDLKDAVPLRTGDRLTLRCEVPRGLHPSIFWFDTEGKLTELAPVAVNPTESEDQVLYPAQGVVPLTGPPGTELILICARRSGPVGRAEVETLFADGRPLPPLPRSAVVRWDRDALHLEFVRGVGTPESNPIRDLHERLEVIRRETRNRFEFIAGVAFSHQERP